MRNSTGGAAARAGQALRIWRNANKNGASSWAKMRMDFGDRFAYNHGAAHSGKLSEGEQYGQESLEEVEEDPTDQAADGSFQEVGPSSIDPSALLDGARSGTSAFERQAGPLPERQRPFLVFGAV
jgi:hypothetical protein